MEFPRIMATRTSICVFVSNTLLVRSVFRQNVYTHRKTFRAPVVRVDPDCITNFNA